MPAKKVSKKSTASHNRTKRVAGGKGGAKKSSKKLMASSKGKSGPSRQRALGGALAGNNIKVLIVNIIPRSFSGEINNDAEPNLAVNPTNPLQMAASAFTPNPSRAGRAPIFISNDGGLTWALNFILPSTQITADITLRFSGTTNNLYAGIIPQPIDRIGNRIVPRLRILRTSNFAGATPMSVLVDRRGNEGVDQPYIQAITGANGASTGKDLVFVGDNDANNLDGRTATIDLSANAAGMNPGFKIVGIDARPPIRGGDDAPSIRPIIHPDGTVYGAFLHMVGGTDPSNLAYDVTVVRDDNFGLSGNPFTALTDPSDNLPGRRVVQNRIIPFLPDPQTGDPGPLGQERIGSHLSIAVDPRPGQSSTVYIVWADMANNMYTLHLRRSTDRGQTWSSNDLLQIPNALNPALAINSDGKVGLLYQKFTGPFRIGVVTAANFWETHLQRSVDGISYDDLVLAKVPASTPPANGSLPYLGDYVHLLTVGKDFYGIFSANNTPDPANFPAAQLPNGRLVYQRNHDFTTRRLFDVDGTTRVSVSIDPFFFKVAE